MHSTSSFSFYGKLSSVLFSLEPALMMGELMCWSVVVLVTGAICIRKRKWRNEVLYKFMENMDKIKILQLSLGVAPSWLWPWRYEPVQILLYVFNGVVVRTQSSFLV